MAFMKNIQHTFECPINWDAEQREEFGFLIMNEIRKRCSEGKSANGDSFSSYSKEYKESEAFLIAGKTSKVNLKLTGDMLASMTIVRHSIGKVVIGYELDDPLAGQVEGNQIGSYGRSTAVSSQARPFLGLPQARLQALIRDVSKGKDTEATKGINSIIGNLIKGLL